MLTWPAAEAVVLDMDGVLIDTEPVWRAAQSAVFAGFGVALSERDLLDSTGQPIEELIPVWRRRSAVGAGAAERADPGLTDAAIAGLIVDRVIAHVTAEGRPMPGVTAAIALFERCGLRLAIASSSPLRLIDAVCDRLAETLAVADGVIVGTSLKVDGITWNRVDPARARRFMDMARQARSAPAVVS